jgi:hypothetical protein
MRCAVRLPAAIKSASASASASPDVGEINLRDTPRCPVTCRDQIRIRVAAPDIDEIKLRDTPRCPVTCRNQVRIRIRIRVAGCRRNRVAIRRAVRLPAAIKAAAASASVARRCISANQVAIRRAVRLPAAIKPHPHLRRCAGYRRDQVAR